MHRLPLEQQILLVIQSAALVALCVRLWWTKLYRTYPYFFDYLLLAVLQTAILTTIPFYSIVYRDAWLGTEALIVCFYALIVLELYSVVLRDLTGIAGVARRFIKIAIAVGIVASLSLLGFEKTPSNLTGQFLIFEHIIVSSLVVFVLLLTAFLFYYPIPLNRNVIIYTIGYAVYFLTKASGLFIRNLGVNLDRAISTLFLVVYSACLLFWAFALSQPGEKKSMVIGHRWNRGETDRLLAQLKAINASLARTARK